MVFDLSWREVLLGQDSKPQGVKAVEGVLTLKNSKSGLKSGNLNEHKETKHNPPSGLDEDVRIAYDN